LCCLGFLRFGGLRRSLGLLGLGRGFGLRLFLGLRRSGLLRRGLRIADREDAQQGHLLAVPGLAAIIVPAALLEDDDLLALRLGDDLGGDGDLARFGQLLAVTGEQNVAQHDRVTGIASELLDRDLVSGGHALLLAARAHYCEHGHQIRSFRLPFSRAGPYERQKRRPEGTASAPPLGEWGPSVNAASAQFRPHPARWRQGQWRAKAQAMDFNRACLIAALGCTLSACAASARYPSLAIRDAERVTGTMQPAEPEPYVPPPPASTVLDQLDRLTGDAATAHRAFLAALPQARSA